MDDYDNIYRLERVEYIPPEYKNYAMVKEKIISLLKENDFSISESGKLFLDIVKTLGNTSFSEL